MRSSTKCCTWLDNLPSLDRGAIKAEVFVVSIRIQSLKNAQKGTVIAPLTEAAVHTLVGAITFGNVRPGRTASCQPKHGIQHQTVILRWSACFGAGDHILDPFPLCIAEFISSCCDTNTPMLFLLFYRILASCATFLRSISFQIRPKFVCN